MGRARDLLGPEGPFGAALAYEHREGQLAMADAVERALADAGVLLCEAGTGTGKTLAYLVPALLSGQKVVVSTATKALQDQIVGKDLPLVELATGIRPQVAVAKGLSNYLCLRRFDELRRSHTEASRGGRSLPLLEAWARSTESGDVAEATALAERDPIWAEVTSSSETRVGPRCEFHEACFVTRMRRSLANADLIVANHHLFFADLALKARAGEAGASRAGVLPPYDAVIFDEAHQIEDVATTFFGAQISTSKLGAFARDAERAFVSAKLHEGMVSRGDGLGLLGAVRVAGEVLFDAVVRAAPRGAGEGRVLLEPGGLGAAAHGAWRELDDALGAVEHFAETHTTTEAVDTVRRRAEGLRSDLALILEPATHQVAWVEARARSVMIGVSVVDVGSLLAGHLFTKVGSVVLTSATLSTQAAPAAPAEAPRGAFDFVRSRLGLDEELGFPVEELVVPSPFDFASRALLYLPRDLPEPSDAAFAEQATERVHRLVTLTGGGAFVLSTSLRGMNAFAAGLMRRGVRDVFTQGDAPKSELLDRFRAHGHAVLVATASFWEGVDVPGEALRLVMIDKLPFAVPTDAIVAARSGALEARGQSAFSHYLLPQAAISLKQGFGRLLRRAEDRGVVAVLDRRIVTKGYGKRLLQGLPPAPRTERFEDVEAFWARVGGAPT